MNSRKVVYAGFFVALGVIFPQIIHLAFGPGLGSILLPMHIPVILSGFFCGPLFGLLVGLSCPLLSFLITGMPPAPLFGLMMVELAVYGAAAGLLYNVLKINHLVSLILAMICGRLAFAFTIFISANLLMIKLPKFINAFQATITGLPGIIIQLLLIPTILTISKRGWFNAAKISRS